jgi:hypothetical protein
MRVLQESQAKVRQGLRRITREDLMKSLPVLHGPRLHQSFPSTSCERGGFAWACLVGRVMDPRCGGQKGTERVPGLDSVRGGFVQSAGLDATISELAFPRQVD